MLLSFRDRAASALNALSSSSSTEFGDETGILTKIMVSHFAD
jgi:hypothetical protein